MDVADTISAPQPSTGLIIASPKTSEPSVKHSDESERVHGGGQASSLRTQCHDFLEKLKSRFGEQSQESASIHNTLGTFSAGRMSKRDAHWTILNTLGDNDDLKQDLKSILHHPKAAWSPEDFNEPEHVYPARETHTSPEFLQPQHYPQLRMPSMPSPWYSNNYGYRPQQMQTSINPALLRTPLTHHVPDRSVFQSQRQEMYIVEDDRYQGYERQVSYHPAFLQNAHNTQWNQFTQAIPSSPVAHVSEPIRIHTSEQYISPTTTQSPSFAPFASNSHELRFGSSDHDIVSHQQRVHPYNENWESSDSRGAWSSAELGYPSECMSAFIGGTQSHSPYTLNEHPALQLAPSQRNSTNATPSILGSPYAIPLGQPALEMVPPTKRNRNGSLVYMRMIERGSDEETGFSRRSPPPLSEPPLSVRQMAQIKPRPAAQFIHAICGKGFSSRSAVKKHHWGAKTEDIATTTGCWAKHGKPNIQWDEHPSCKGVLSKSRNTKTTQPATPDFKAPVVPEMLPNHQNMIPGFPTLHDLPEIVSQAIHSAHAPVQFSQDRVTPYHTSRLPSQGRMDALLTAVNVASRIDAPKPQGRNDSVVSNLDAQAAAAERRQQEYAYRAVAPQDMIVGHACQEFDTLPDVGLGITQLDSRAPVPAGIVVQSQREHIRRAAGTIEDVTSNTIGAVGSIRAVFEDEAPRSSIDATLDGDDKKRRRAPRSAISKREQKMLGLSVSPNPEKKKQKVLP